jgi:carbamoyl-phosphate synthase large subunit
VRPPSMPAGNGRGPRILVTGTGGPSGFSFMRALRGDAIQLLSADIDPHAPGLFLVDPAHRLLLPRGDDPDFAGTVLGICREREVDVVVPTVDSELVPLAESRDEFEAAGISLLVAPTRALRRCLDKWGLMQVADGSVPIPRSAPLDDDFDPDSFDLPVLVKPRVGSGSRGVRRVDSWDDLGGLRDRSLLVQEFLPGPEYSLDVLATITGEVRAVVPRERLRVDSGIAITSRTVHDDELESVGRAAAEVAGITGVANVQVMRDATGTPRLIEINPRFPGTMPLTVASGVNMPRLALGELLGEPIPDGPLEFRDVAMTRVFEEVIVDLDQLADLEAEAKCEAVAS